MMRPCRTQYAMWFVVSFSVLSLDGETRPRECQYVRYVGFDRDSEGQTLFEDHGMSNYPIAFEAVSFRLSNARGDLSPFVDSKLRDAKA